MKLELENHLFLTHVALQLKVDKDHMLDLFETATKCLMGAHNDALQSIHRFQRGDISKAQLDSDMNVVGDLVVVQSIYDKLSDALIEAFDAASAYHITRMKDDPDFIVN